MTLSTANLVVLLCFLWINSEADCSKLFFKPRYGTSDICRTVRQTYICTEIPSNVPENITEVIIENHHGELPESPFIAGSWNRVIKLYLHCPHASDFHDHQFKGLYRVTELSLRFPEARKFKPLSLYGLDNVKRFAMLEMSLIDFKTFQDAFMVPNSLPMLEEFIFNPGEHMNTPVLYITEDFTNTLLSRPITTLNISYAVITGKIQTGIMIILKLDILNVSHSLGIPVDTGAVTHSPFKHFLDVQSDQRTLNPSTQNTKDIAPKSAENEPEIVFHNATLQVSRYLVDGFNHPLLQVCDVSYARAPRTLSGSDRKYSDPNLFQFNEFLLLIVDLYANKVQYEDTDFSEHHDLRKSPVYLKRLYVRENNVVKINASILLPKNNSVELVDLCVNKIEYINPGIFLTFTVLKYLYLAQNRLHKMELYTDFSLIFKSLHNLEVLDMSENGISYIPRNMFTGNDKLVTLNLANNQLSTVNFNMDKLLSLETLDLHGNHIRYLDSTALENIKLFVQFRIKRGVEERLRINVEDNPLECTCRNIEFIKWIALNTVSRDRVRIETSDCSYEGSSLAIDENAVSKCNFLCKRRLMTTLAASISCSVILLIVCFTVIIKIYLKRNRRLTKEERFRSDFRAGNLHHDLIAFVAFSSNDEDIVENTVLESLKNGLRNRLKTNKKVIGTGSDFRPGCTIMEETYRLVQLSCVFVAVLSESFCKSMYCKAEIQEACNQHKPIMILAIENVVEADMTPYVQEVFRRNSRAKLVTQSNGHIKFVPDLDTVCDSILHLAQDVAYE